MGKYIKCVVKAPNKIPLSLEINNDLETIQASVGGRIETVPVTDDIIAIVNEEGKLRGLAPNIYVRWDAQGRMRFLPNSEGANDVLVGNVIFVGRKGHDFRSLTEKEVEDLIYSVEKVIIIKGLRGIWYEGQN